jgi:Holliday junction DNA helicase RuvA
MDLHTFVQCVHEHNIIQLTRISGVGKKTAERLVVEMQDKLTEFGDVTESEFSLASAGKAALTQGLVTPVEDAISALIALGYKPQEASRRVHAVEEKGLSSEMLIRKALQG